MSTKTADCNCQRYSCLTCRKRGRKVTSFSDVDFIPADYRFTGVNSDGTAAQNQNVPYSTLIADLAAQIGNGGNDGVVIEIDEDDSPYQMNGTEGIIYCTGECEIILPSAVGYGGSVTINAEDGVVTVTPQGTDTIQNGFVVSPNSARYGAKPSTFQWRLL